MLAVVVVVVVAVVVAVVVVVVVAVVVVVVVVVVVAAAAAAAVRAKCAVPLLQSHHQRQTPMRDRQHHRCVPHPPSQPLLAAGEATAQKETTVTRVKCQ